MRSAAARAIMVVSATLLTGAAALAAAGRFSPGAAPTASSATLPALEDEPLPPHSVYFTRAAYTANGRYPGWKDWSTDYPKADRQFLVVLRRLLGVDVYEQEHPVRLDDPALSRYPFIYLVEAGQMRLTDAEIEGLRHYLLAGGFMVVDDFWGSAEWASFEEQMRLVLPENPIVELPPDHPVFHSVYDVEEVMQIPNVAIGAEGGPTHEQDGFVAHVRGIEDSAGRLMVAINWNTDLGDAWEWAENPAYPLRFSTYAYRMGVNFMVYAMSH